jgi:hypothetical protein
MASQAGVRNWHGHLTPEMTVMLDGQNPAPRPMVLHAAPTRDQHPHHGERGHALLQWIPTESDDQRTEFHILPRRLFTGGLVGYIGVRIFGGGGQGTVSLYQRPTDNHVSRGSVASLSGLFVLTKVCDVLDYCRERFRHEWNTVAWRTLLDKAGSTRVQHSRDHEQTEFLGSKVDRPSRSSTAQVSEKNPS